MAEDTTTQDTGATPTDAPVANVEQRSEDQMLADILRVNNESGLFDKEESLPEKQDDVPTPSEDTADDQDIPEVSETEEVEELTEEEVESKDDETLPEDNTYAPEELDNFNIKLKINGEDVIVSKEDLIKGYSTDQSLSQKGRELGDARKALDEERTSKIGEIDQVMGAANQILLKSENTHAKEYGDLKGQIAKAREEGDSYALTELKDKQDQAQEKYWAARNEREMLLGKADEQRQAVHNEAFNQQVETFNKGIKEVIPTWSEDTAANVRDYALNKKIPEDFLNYITDVNIVKFVHDAMVNDQARSKGTVKRQAVKVKATPVKKSIPKTEKKIQAEQANRDRVLSGKGTDSDNTAFLRNLAARHFE